ncbi:integration host factor, actinobacterial type [Corynebacterium sp.]|uniref:integration host factor, actinobacterial type n=1 Tax=Corynebacterium sp. TaxID=1720 RepID=UPI003B3AF12C
MSLPTLTPEQREAALEKSRAVRRLRAELKNDLKDGKLTLEDVLEGRAEIAEKMKVSQLLAVLPNVGKKRAEDLMLELGIAPSRRVRGLGPRQTRELLTRFGFTTKL